MDLEIFMYFKIVHELDKKITLMKNVMEFL
jgi:hypothetical protein